MTKNITKITKNENAQNVPRLEVIEVILDHCNIANIDYQHHLTVLYTFVLSRSFGQLLNISPKQFFWAPLIWIFHILKYSLLIKILNLLIKIWAKILVKVYVKV